MKHVQAVFVIDTLRVTSYVLIPNFQSHQSNVRWSEFIH